MSSLLPAHDGRYPASPPKSQTQREARPPIANQDFLVACPTQTHTPRQLGLTDSVNARRGSTNPTRGICDATGLYPAIPSDPRDMQPFKDELSKLKSRPRVSPPASPLTTKIRHIMPQGSSRAKISDVITPKREPDPSPPNDTEFLQDYSPVATPSKPRAGPKLQPIDFPILRFNSTGPPPTHNGTRARRFEEDTHSIHNTKPSHSKREASIDTKFPIQPPPVTPQRTTMGPRLHLTKPEASEFHLKPNSLDNGQLPTPFKTPVRSRPPKSATGHGMATPTRRPRVVKGEDPSPYFDCAREINIEVETPPATPCTSDRSTRRMTLETPPATPLRVTPSQLVGVKSGGEGSMPNLPVNVDALARRINARLIPGGLCDKERLPGWDDNPADAAPSFFYKLPKHVPLFLAWGPVVMLANGHSLKPYQGVDFQRLLRREQGEAVCGTDVMNNVGYLIAYPMGYGKTPLSIALILQHKAPKGFKGSRATLVLCPTQGIMINWRSEIQKFAPQLRICFYDSSSVYLDTKADVVLMTYDQLRYQRRCFIKPTSNCDGRVFRIVWFRICGDEIQYARNPDTKLAEALLALKKVHAICLSGTPVQNSWRDLYVTLVFLGLIYQGLNNLETFERLIYSKRQKGPITNPAAQQRLDTVISSFVIHRPAIDPTTGKALVVLPKRTDTTIKVVLSSQERMIYDLIKDYPESIFAKFTRRRQACDHPILLSKVLKQPPSDGDIEMEVETGEHDIMRTDSAESEDIHAVNLALWPADLRHCFKNEFVSAKLAVLKKILLTRLSGQKTIIFTSFVELLPAIFHLLSKINILAAQYTGNMSVMQRDKALNRIASDPDCTVIIVSLMAGGTGLNITACDTVVVLEPWWNPYVEEQAIARVHRIGQTRPVHVYHLVTEDTIEESIMKTQKLKRETLGGLYGEYTVPDETVLATWLAGP